MRPAAHGVGAVCDRPTATGAEEITKTLTGNWGEEHLFVLRQALTMYDDILRNPVLLRH